MTYKLIASQTLAVDTNKVSFDNIPSSSTYNDLMVIMRVQDIATSSQYYTGGVIYYNNVTTGTTYQSNLAGRANTTAITNWSAGVAYAGYLATESANFPTQFSVNTVYFTNYSSSISPKTAITNGAVSNNTVNQARIQSSAEFATSSAITRLDFQAPSNKWAAGSSFYLYGIKRA
jgi:hypothetical protein